MTEPPDLPRREPTPSIAAFPFSLHSLLKGMKAISLVASNSVYLEARARQFCKEPKKTHNINGDVPRKAETPAKLESLKKKKKKNAMPVTRSMQGEIKALAVQLKRRITVPDTKMLVTVATMPIHMRTCPIYALKSEGFG